MPFYVNAPVQEAICEFRFDPSAPWDMAVPGLFYEKVKDEFPKRKPVKSVENLGTETSQEIKHQVNFIDRLQCWNEDEKAIVQVSNHFAAANHLAPYAGWAVFKPMILKSLSAYIDAAGESDIQRIALRYIDRIAIPATENIEINKWFSFYAQGPNMSTRPGDLTAFMVGQQYLCEDQRDLLSIDLASGGVEDDHPIFILNTQYVLLKVGSLKSGDVPEWLDLAHSKLVNAFEGCLTDNLRAVFKGEYHEN
ncbi:MAG: hypothetical protein JWN14_3807 [Chthonomonadales bacterium]|nr:hypothetical protein [Chthonomonadales bacterium]